MSASKGDEPNLVPLLDLVLQLVMFFMVCANFVMEQVNETIKLPPANASKPLDKSGDKALFLNVTSDGKVILSSADAVGTDKVLTNAEAVRSYMVRRYDEDMRTIKPEDRPKGPKLRLVIRADEKAKFKDVNAIMSACRKAGFINAEVRVIKQ